MTIDVSEELAGAIDRVLQRRGVPPVPDWALNLADELVIELSGKVVLLPKEEHERTMGPPEEMTVSSMAKALTQALKYAIDSVPDAIFSGKDAEEGWDATTAQLIVGMCREGLVMLPAERYYAMCSAQPRDSLEQAFRRGALAMLDKLSDKQYLTGSLLTEHLVSEIPPYEPPA